MSSDTFVCPVCHVKVKTKLKRAHDVSAKHREKLRQQTAPKRPAAQNSEFDDLIAKRPRPDNVGIEQHSAAVKQVEAEEVASGLPANFFDSAVKEQEAAAAEDMEKEFSRFVQEVNEIERVDNETTDHHDALRNELDDIDEQIEMWRNLNEIEKQKEQLISDVRARVTVETNQKPMETEDDDEDDDFDISSLDWRARRV
ncbi:hypothetical protein M3Y94_00117500 [Aphelenchoides besseyi]|nr:hypothetical protein M3Y94_00117500 [Aphelenchoides besseyi]KAI6237445.1 hypothetical protein M3Y95_00265800 [Aphelenchoides besseyi]